MPYSVITGNTINGFTGSAQRGVVAIGNSMSIDDKFFYSTGFSFSAYTDYYLSYRYRSNRKMFVGYAKWDNMYLITTQNSPNTGAAIFTGFTFKTTGFYSPTTLGFGYEEDYWDFTGLAFAIPADGTIINFSGGGAHYTPILFSPGDSINLFEDSWGSGIGFTATIIDYNSVSLGYTVISTSHSGTGTYYYYIKLNEELWWEVDEVNLFIGPGPSGSSGSSGASGTDGTSGSSGTGGSSGSSGTSGTDGSSGTSSNDGSSGTSGTDGSSGVSGSSGTSGTSSVVSTTSGSSGTSGIDGVSQISGDSGSSGTSGASNTSGSSGTSGTGGGSGAYGSNYYIQVYDNAQTGNIGSFSYMVLSDTYFKIQNRLAIAVTGGTTPCLELNTNISNANNAFFEFSGSTNMTSISSNASYNVASSAAQGAGAVSGPNWDGSSRGWILNKAFKVILQDNTSNISYPEWIMTWTWN